MCRISDVALFAQARVASTPRFHLGGNKLRNGFVVREEEKYLHMILYATPSDLFSYLILFGALVAK